MSHLINTSSKMKIINFFQRPHITSLILAIVFTSHQALAATTAAVTPRTCNQNFVPSLKTTGVFFCRSDLVLYECQLNSCKVDNKPFASATFKNCDLLDSQRGNVVPGRQQDTIIPLQYHVVDSGVEVLNKADVQWYRCYKTDKFNDHRANQYNSTTRTRFND
ncbi:hypothetical protein H4Q26_008118 [Puccinia striiformis f. sp. tritici PST-130]|nr:hypothetical protein H4Q26_008118 [Puccinia striiformis f. sp. tritici PST-130]